jgi:hypothetical protein
MKIGRKIRRAYTLFELVIAGVALGIFGTGLFILFLLIKILWNFAFPH